MTTRRGGGARDKWRQVPFGRAFRIPVFCSRRDFLRRTGSGFGMLALSAMLAETMQAATAPVNPLAAKLPVRPAHTTRSG